MESDRRSTSYPANIIISIHVNMHLFMQRQYMNIILLQYYGMNVNTLDYYLFSRGRAGGSNTKVKQVKIVPLIKVHSKVKSI